MTSRGYQRRTGCINRSYSSPSYIKLCNYILEFCKGQPFFGELASSTLRFQIATVTMSVFIIERACSKRCWIYTFYLLIEAWGTYWLSDISRKSWQYRPSAERFVERGSGWCHSFSKWHQSEVPTDNWQIAKTFNWQLTNRWKLTDNWHLWWAFANSLQKTVSP